MKKYIVLSLLFTSIGLMSCKKYFGDINKNPNNPLTVEPKIMLPGIEVAISYTFGGDGARFSGILNQQIKGVTRQWAVLEQYTFVGSDVETMYEYNIYPKILMEIQNLKQISTENGYFYYNGVAKTLEAYTLMFLADFWDAAPYSEAFKGLDKLQPKYDSNSELYQTVFALLNEARSDMAHTDGGVKVPSNDDLMYNGDMNKWIGLTYFLEARANLRLAKADPSKYQTALTLVGSGLTSDLAFPYSGGAFSNPMFQFIMDWSDLEIGTRISELLTTYNDPRTSMYNQPFDQTNTYLTGDKDHVIASLIEQEFIKAECTFRILGSATAHPFYINGITLALQRDGISQTDINTYLSQMIVDPGNSNLTLELIMNQKYLALFLEHETFTDWRRTGYPTLVPNNGSQIPRSFPTPQGEMNLNGANAPQRTIFTPVSWDI